MLGVRATKGATHLWMQALLAILDSPLNKSGKVKVLMHGSGRVASCVL
jgi:rRNA pseudouridine-1189 N-methylase Emg1 (Nep1/Mra1 family)